MTLATRVILLIVATLSVAAAATPDAALVGTWRLVSVTSISSEGEKNSAPYGSAPKGFITYTRDGRMSVVVSYSGRKKLSMDRTSGSVEEKAEAYSTSFAYAGRYTFTGDKVTHHVETATTESWIGTDLMRTVQIEGARVALRTPMRALGGRMQSTELVWERIGAE